LADGDGHITGDENLVAYATAYYKALFGPGIDNSFEMEQDLWADEEKVTVQENADLIKPFEEVEIKTALFQMEKNKVAGPDGFPIEFYQQCWHLINKDMMDYLVTFTKVAWTSRE
jgi:hypothetical protein